MESLIDKYRVYVLDFDGTLWNGSTRIGGVAPLLLELYKRNKIVLYYTNGGWCSLQYSYECIVKWVDRELSQSDAEFVKARLSIDHVYNTAQLAAKYLLQLIDS